MSATSNFANGDYLETPNGSHFVRIIGEGSPLIVVHGGPGLDHDYLVEWLLPLSKYRKLVFYDQCGCGRDRTPHSQVSALKIFNQLSSLIKYLDLGNKAGLFGHSWGTNVILSTLQNNPSLKPNEVILSNPMALTSELFGNAGKRLWDRIPSATQNQITALDAEKSENAGVKLMQLALPYYVASPNLVPNVKFSSYSIVTYERVVETLGDFDLRNATSFLPSNTLVIYGEGDFGSPEDSLELLSVGSDILSLPNVGHFPFAEDPKSFQAKVISFIEKAH